MIDFLLGVHRVAPLQDDVYDTLSGSFPIYAVQSAQKINSIAHYSHSAREDWDFPGRDSRRFPKLYRG